MEKLYTEKIIAFIDIIGFTKLTEKADNNPRLLKEIIEKLNYLQGVCDHSSFYNTDLSTRNKILKNDPIKTTAVSDCIIMSSSVTQQNFIEIYQRIRMIISDLSDNRLGEFPLAVRGGITLGNMIHEDNFIFGKGYLRAVELEKKAEIPIILFDEVIAQRSGFIKYFKDFCIEGCEEIFSDKSYKGLYFFNLSRYLVNSINSRQSYQNLLPLPGPERSLNMLRDIISRELENNNDNKIKNKWIKMSDLFNKSIVEIKK